MRTDERTRQADRAVAVEPYDLFISYHRNDSRSAREVARELRCCGVRVWMDELNMSPDDLWQKEIARAIDSSRAFAVLTGPSGLGGWQELEVQMALLIPRARNLRIVAVLLPGARESATVQALLAPLDHCDLRELEASAQLEKLAERLCELQADLLVATDLSWLEQLFRDAGKTLPRPNGEHTGASPRPISAQQRRPLTAARRPSLSPFAMPRNARRQDG